jgi:hypothetical protein
MSAILITVDQVPGGGSVNGPRLELAAERVTAREIIRQRVITEVERYNSDEGARRHVGLLIAQPPEERVLNGPRRQQREPLNPERQIEAALAAVRAGRVIVMFNGEQVTDLDAPLLVTPVSEARFLRLVPLVGG